MNSLYDEFRVALHSVWTRRWLVLAVAWGICILGWLAIPFAPVDGGPVPEWAERPLTA